MFGFSLSCRVLIGLRGFLEQVLWSKRETLIVFEMSSNDFLISLVVCFLLEQEGVLYSGLFREQALVRESLTTFTRVVQQQVPPLTSHFSP